jgi:hypothetical protein
MAPNSLTNDEPCAAAAPLDVRWHNAHLDEAKEVETPHSTASRNSLAANVTPITIPWLTDLTPLLDDSLRVRFDALVVRSVALPR